MTEQFDPYAVLGVAPDATEQGISHAYRRLLRCHHPDTQQSRDDSATDATAKLQQILKAYALLRDPTSRAQYDREPVRTRRVNDPAKRVRPARYFAVGDPVSSGSDVPIRAGPVRWHRDPAGPRSDGTNG
jgi:curved DNA-binding protein CbpA